MCKFLHNLLKNIVILDNRVYQFEFGQIWVGQNPCPTRIISSRTKLGSIFSATSRSFFISDQQQTRPKTIEEKERRSIKVTGETSPGPSWACPTSQGPSWARPTSQGPSWACLTSQGPSWVSQGPYWALPTSPGSSWVLPTSPGPRRHRASFSFPGSSRAWPYHCQISCIQYICS